MKARAGTPAERSAKTNECHNPVSGVTDTIAALGPLNHADKRKAVEESALIGGRTSPQVLHTYHQNDILSIILKEPDHHGTLAITLHVRNRLTNVERRADPPDTDRGGDPCGEGFHVINLRRGKTAHDMGSARDVFPRSVAHAVAVSAAWRKMSPISAAAARRSA